MSLQDKLDVFRANFGAGSPPYNGPARPLRDQPGRHHLLC